MKITIKKANEMQYKGKKSWFKYKYKVNEIYFKYLQSAINYSNNLKNKKK